MVDRRDSAFCQQFKAAFYAHFLDFVLRPGVTQLRQPQRLAALPDLVQPLRMERKLDARLGCDAVGL